MKDLIHNVEFALQELSLRSIEMIERVPIFRIIDEMNLAMNDMQPSPERAVLRAFVEKLEKVIE